MARPIAAGSALASARAGIRASTYLGERRTATERVVPNRVLGDQQDGQNSPGQHEPVDARGVAGDGQPDPPQDRLGDTQSDDCPDWHCEIEPIDCQVRQDVDDPESEDEHTESDHDRD